MRVAGPRKHPIAARRLLGASALLAATAVAALGLPHEGASAGVTTKPNFLLILVDDQAMNTFKPNYMPEVYRWIVKPGTKFTAGLAAPPVCCPDRAGILTGQYPHNNDVFSNDPGYASLNGKHDTLPIWLRRAGYDTGFDGKFLNDLSVYQGTKPAPGFNFWFGFLEPPGYYDYSMSDNGTQVNLGSKGANYPSDVVPRRASQFLHGVPAGKPWFLWLAYNAPHDTTPTQGSCGHSSPIPPTEDDYATYGHHPLPTPPSFNERDVSDKPSFIAALHHISPAARRHIVTRWKCTLATMHEVDVDVGELMLKLKQSGALSNTIVFYLSDNGYFFGEHRLTRGKSSPYEEALRVPYAVRVPSAYQGTRAPPHASSDVVSNQDIAPRMLDYAGGAKSWAGPNVCRALDGRSLMPLPGGWG